MQYIEYDRHAIKTPPSSLWLEGWRVDYLAFSSPENAHKPPLMVVGGAFQNFTSYKYSVERIYQDFPVILIDLPSLGNNDQLGPELGMEELAELLLKMVQKLGLPKVHMMGLSLGSAVVSTFAYKYPQYMDKLMVAGIVINPRKSWRMLVKESVRVLERGDMMDVFAQGVVLYLVNYHKLHKTGLRPTARRLFYRQMKQLNENERERYKINGWRLYDTKGLIGFPECETLVMTGEYDSFTLPSENAEFASRCPNAKFALVENADHLPQLERREESLNLFSAFLRGDSIEGIEGVRVLDPNEVLAGDRRRSERYVATHPKAQWRLLTHEGELLAQSVAEIVDINFFGCLIKLKEPSVIKGYNLEDLDNQITLHHPELVLGMLVFAQTNEGYLRGIFKHGNIEAAEHFRELLDNEDYFAQIQHQRDEELLAWEKELAL